MSWRKASFKGKTVWAQVNPQGELQVDEGRVPIRYSEGPGARIYRAGASRVAVDPAAPLQELSGGTAADAAPAQGDGKVRGGRSGGGAHAARAAEDLLASLSSETIRAFTDGACRGNPGPAGSGVYIEFPDGRRFELARSLGRATNNIAELTAIDLALDQLEREDTSLPIAVLTDSSYSIGVLVKGWKAKANQELVARIRERVGRMPGITFHWVAGHVGTEGNERADALANEGVEGLSFEQWTA